VMDFGIAKLPDTEGLTEPDKLIGTPSYISVEQAKGSKKIDTRSDIYSLGVMMYHLATGKLPFIGDSPVSIIMKHINDKPIPPRKIDGSIPQGLEQLILCAMHKNPARRFADCKQMLGYVQALIKQPDKVFAEPIAQNGQRVPRGGTLTSDVRRRTSDVKTQKNTSENAHLLRIIIAIVAGFAVVTAIVAIIIVKSMNLMAPTPNSVEIPDFVGKVYYQIQADLTEYDVEKHYVYGTGTPGKIVSQSPSPGSKRKAGEFVLVLTVIPHPPTPSHEGEGERIALPPTPSGEEEAVGAELTIVPNVLGFSETAARVFL